MNKRGEEAGTEGWKLVLTIALSAVAVFILSIATYKIISVMTT